MPLFDTRVLSSVLMHLSSQTLYPSHTAGSCTERESEVMSDGAWVLNLIKVGSTVPIYSCMEILLIA